MIASVYDCQIIVIIKMEKKKWQYMEVDCQRPIVPCSLFKKISDVMASNKKYGFLPRVSTSAC